MGVATRHLPARRRDVCRSARRLRKSKWTSRPASTRSSISTCVADVGTVIHPRALGGQILGRSILGIGHAIGQKWVYDQKYGVALARRFYQNKPPTILDVPTNMEWAAVELADPETPVGATRHRRAAGRGRLLGGAERDLRAVGDEVFRRAPVNADGILASLEAGRPMGLPLTANV